MKSAGALPVLFLLLTLPAFGYAPNSLNSESIAVRAEQVAKSTNTSGYCYAAVSKALKPLGVDLYGQSAYQAKELLLKDDRFEPLAVYSVDQLWRGDIIVYQKSAGHPHGHISVYQGNYEEASDHISAVTHTQAYGGATVFRLKNAEEQAPPIAPPAAMQSAAMHGVDPVIVGAMHASPTVNSRSDARITPALKKAATRAIFRFAARKLFYLLQTPRA